MIKKIIILFKIGRKLALSDALNIISKVYKIPLLIKIFFSIFGLMREIMQPILKVNNEIITFL